jgi:hypothetical protein
VRYEIGLFRQGVEEPAAEGWFVHVFVDRESAARSRSPRRCARRSSGSSSPTGCRRREGPRRGAARDGAAGAVRRVAPAGDRRPRAGTAGPGELLVRVGAAGLCHSDLSVIDGSRPRVMPMVLGHEAAGEVVEVGPHAGRSSRATTSCWRSCPPAVRACRAWTAAPRCASRAPRRTPRARCSAATGAGTAAITTTWASARSPTTSSSARGRR